MSKNTVLEQILDGDFKDYYVIYNRKSTDDANNQRNSLAYQKKVNLSYALEQKLKIAPITAAGFIKDGTISEKHSAFKEDELMEVDENGRVSFKVDRPKFYQLVSFLNKKLFKGVIFLVYDRASRNKPDHAIIGKLRKAKVDLRFSMADYDKNASGDLHMDIDGMFSAHHSRMTSEKVKGSARQNRAEGLCIYGAPVGYLNEGTMENKPFDPVRAPIVKRMFELANDNWSTRDIAKWATDEGFTMPDRRPRRTKDEILADEEDDAEDTREKQNSLIKFNGVNLILRNNFYIGLIKGNDGEFINSSSHEPLVDEELFYSVQNKLSKKNKSKHYDKPLEYAFRNLFKCTDCNRSYTPYPKKGILYVGCRCIAGCENPKKNINEKFIDDYVSPYVKRLKYTDEELEQIETNANLDIKSLEQRRKRDIESIENQKKKVRSDLEYLRTEKITLLKTGAYTPEEYREAVSSSEEKIKSLMKSEQISEEAMMETIKDVLKVSELLRRVAMYWDFATTYEKDSILRTIFSELTISGTTVTCKVNLEFKPFEQRILNSGAQERT